MFDSLAPSEIVAKLIGIGARRGSALLERSTPPSFSAIAAVAGAAVPGAVPPPS